MTPTSKDLRVEYENVRACSGEGEAVCARNQCARVRMTFVHVFNRDKSRATACSYARGGVCGYHVWLFQGV